VNPSLSGDLPAFLVKEGGLNSGFMMIHVTAAALVSECKANSFPASVDSIPTSAGKEDHVSMGPIAARHARTVLEHVERIVAIELRVAAEAIDHRRRLLADEAAEGGPSALAPGAGVAEAHARIRALVPSLDGDREPGPDLAAVTRIVHEGTLVDLVASAPDSGGPA